MNSGSLIWVHTVIYCPTPIPKSFFIRLVPGTAVVQVMGMPETSDGGGEDRGECNNGGMASVMMGECYGGVSATTMATVTRATAVAKGSEKVVILAK